MVDFQEFISNLNTGEKILILILAIIVILFFVFGGWDWLMSLLTPQT